MIPNRVEIPIIPSPAFFDNGTQWERTVDQAILVDQLTFPASQDASADANTLDDYEEGTFTPTIEDTGHSDKSQTYSVQVGGYTKIGRVVFIQGRVTLSGLGALTAGDQAFLAGFPFASSSTANLGSAVHIGYAGGLAITAGSKASANITPGKTYANMQLWDATTGASALLISEVTLNGDIRFAAHYEV